MGLRHRLTCWSPKSHSADWCWHENMQTKHMAVLFLFPFLLVPLNFSIQIVSFCAKKSISHTRNNCSPSPRLKLDRVMLTAMALRKMETFCIRLSWSKNLRWTCQRICGTEGFSCKTLDSCLSKNPFEWVNWAYFTSTARCTKLICLGHTSNGRFHFYKWM